MKRAFVLFLLLSFSFAECEKLLETPLVNSYNFLEKTIGFLPIKEKPQILFVSMQELTEQCGENSPSCYNYLENNIYFSCKEEYLDNPIFFETQLVHELVHYLTPDVFMQNKIEWIYEGLAVYYEYKYSTIYAKHNISSEKCSQINESTHRYTQYGCLWKLIFENRSLNFQKAVFIELNRETSLCGINSGYVIKSILSKIALEDLTDFFVKNGFDAERITAENSSILMCNIGGLVFILTSLLIFYLFFWIYTKVNRIIKKPKKKQ